MQITEIRTRAASVPLEIPIVSAIHRTERVEFVIIEVMTTSGLVGQSYVQTFGVHPARAVRSIVAYLGDVLHGENAALTLRCWQLMDRAINLLGRGGLATFALSGIDCALWDLLGKACQTPVAILLGASGDRCSAYQSAGLWLDEPGPALAEQAEALLDPGFLGVKMRVGRGDIDADHQAAQIVRDAIGPGRLLLIDANQAWDVNQAIGIGRSLESVRPHWIEEPIDHDDFAGHAEIARALTAPIATGENVYMPRGFQRLLEAQACDVVMPDIQRVGGVTGWMQVAALAAVHRLPLATHLFPEISIHVLAASPSAQILEYVPWAQPIMAEKIIIQNGSVVVPPRPGLGLVFDDAAIAQHGFD